MKMYRMVLFITLIIFVGVGASLSLKAAVGVGAWNALAQSISHLSSVKVGTIVMVLNSFCVLGQWLLLRRKFGIKNLLQLPVGIVIGAVINIIYYDVLGGFTVEIYFYRLVLLIVAYNILASSVAAVIVLDVISFPLEGFCMVLSEQKGWSFSIVRQLVDVFSILIVLILTLLLSIESTIREGTFIGMLLLGPLMGYYMRLIAPVLRSKY
jgi:uncharacterized membrane protein YczE